ncbi:hypothetical protein Gogos_021991, partial [Gossypium gossypioides]|nr:hypothetical protein [Gossypium gossypioides]
LHFALAFTKTIAILVVTILDKGNKRQKRRPQKPDGALPFIGHLHLFGKNQLLHRIFADMVDKHGPAFLIRLGVHRALVQSVKNEGVALLEMKERIGDLATNIIVRMVAGKIYHGTSEKSRRFQKALMEESDIANLVYLQAIIKEIMRLYPAVLVSVAREAMDDYTVADFHIPTGTQLFLSDHANIDMMGQNFELIPFGAGKRICPGVDMSERPGIIIPKATPLEVTLTPKLPS